MMSETQQDKYFETISKFEFLYEYLPNYDTCEISSLNLITFKQYVDNLKKLIENHKEDMVMFVKENFIYDDMCVYSFTLEHLLIMYKYLLSLYDSDTCSHNVGTYTSALLEDFLSGHEVIYDDVSSGLKENLSEQKKQYMMENINKLDLIDFFDSLVDNMSLSGLFLTVSYSNGEYKILDFRKVISCIFRLKHDKEWKCKLINKLYNRLVEFSKEEDYQEKYYKTLIDDENSREYKRLKTYENSYNKAIDRLYEISIYEDNFHNKFDSDKRYQMLLGVHDVFSQPEANYYTL